MSDLSIWDVVDTIQPHTFEQLIREGASFEDILEQDKFIQEVKSETNVLIDYLCEKSTLEKIIHGLTTITLFEDNAKYEILGNESPEEAEHKRQISRQNFKIPYLCSEILNCHVYSINSAIAKDGRFLVQLLSYLEKRKQFHGKTVNSCHDSYWLKAIHYFLKKYFFEVAIAVLSMDSFVDNVIANMDMFDMDFLVLTLFGLSQDILDDIHLSRDQLKELLESQQRVFGVDVFNIQNDIQKKFAESKFVVKCLESKYGLTNVLSIFTQVQKKGISMTWEIESKSVINSIIDMGVSDVSILKEVIVYLENYLSIWYFTSEKVETKEIPESLQLIVSRTKDLMNLIVSSDIQVNTPAGKFKSFGETGLLVVSHIRALVKCPFVAVQQELMSNKVFFKLFDFFTEYPLNTILHNLILDIFVFVIKFDGLIALKKHLLVDVKIAHRILDASKELRFTKSQIFVIANVLVATSHREKFQFVEDVIIKVPGWIDFVTGDLTKYNDVANKLISGTTFSIPQRSISVQDDSDEIVRAEFSPEEDEGNDDEPVSVLKSTTTVSNDEDFDADFDSAFI